MTEWISSTNEKLLVMRYARRFKKEHCWESQSQRSNNEETRCNYNRNQNKSQNNAEMTEVNELDNMTVTGVQDIAC